MEYNEEQEKEYISRESLNRLCEEAQELRWYKRYRSGAPRLGLLPVISADALPAYRC